MVGSAKFPAVGKVDGDHFSGFSPAVHKSSGQGLDQFSVFGVRDAAVAGRIHDGSLVRCAAAGCQDGVMNKAALRVSLELGAQHAERIVA